MDGWNSTGGSWTKLSGRITPEQKSLWSKGSLFYLKKKNPSWIIKYLFIKVHFSLLHIFWSRKNIHTHTQNNTFWSKHNWKPTPPSPTHLPTQKKQKKKNSNLSIRHFASVRPTRHSRRAKLMQQLSLTSTSSTAVFFFVLLLWQK